MQQLHFWGYRKRFHFHRQTLVNAHTHKSVIHKSQKVEATHDGCTTDQQSVPEIGAQHRTIFFFSLQMKENLTMQESYGPHTKCMSQSQRQRCATYNIGWVRFTESEDGIGSGKSRKAELSDGDRNTVSENECSSRDCTMSQEQCQCAYHWATHTKVVKTVNHVCTWALF